MRRSNLIEKFWSILYEAGQYRSLVKHVINPKSILNKNIVWNLN